MNQEFLVGNIGLFILYNFAAIIGASVIYFFTKEFYRVRNNNPSRAGRVISGSIIGIFSAVLLVFLNYSIKLTPELIPLDWGFGAEVVIPGILLSPAIIFLIIFPVMIDRRLVITIAVFMAFGYFIKIPWNDAGILDNTLEITSIIFAFVTLAIISLAVYFFEQSNLFKNNGIKTIFIIAIYLIIVIALRVVQASFASGQSSVIPIAINNSFKLWGIEVGFTLAVTIVQMSIIYIIERAYANFNKLETFTTQDDISYYKMSLAQNKLKYKIDDEKIGMGLLVLLDLPTEDSNLSSIALFEIRNKLEEENNNSFYFKATNQYYGIFIPTENLDYKLAKSNNKKINRENNDDLRRLEIVLNSVARKYKLNIKAGVSIYGLHSYDTTELIEYSKFLLTPVVRRSNKNRIIVYDFDRVKFRLSERNSVMNMPIDINTLNISYLRGVSKEKVFYPRITYELDGETTTVNSILESKYSNDIKENIIRYTAYQSMRRFNEKNSSLIIYYPISKLSSPDFSMEEFEKKITRYLKKESVIIGLYTNGEKSKVALRNNLKHLKEKGYRLAMMHDENVTQEKHDSIMPDYIIDNSTESNPLKIKEKKINYKTEAIRLNTNLVL